MVFAERSLWAHIVEHGEGGTGLNKSWLSQGRLFSEQAAHPRFCHSPQLTFYPCENSPEAPSDPKCPEELPGLLSVLSLHLAMVTHGDSSTLAFAATLWLLHTNWHVLGVRSLVYTAPVQGDLSSTQ